MFYVDCGPGAMWRGQEPGAFFEVEQSIYYGEV